MMCDGHQVQVIPLCWFPITLTHNFEEIPKTADRHPKEQLGLPIRLEESSSFRHTEVIAPQDLFGPYTHDLRTDANIVSEQVVSQFLNIDH